MNEDNPYQGYANYETPRRSYSADDLGYPDKTGSLLRNPVLATVALLLGASILAGVIIMATPDDGGDVLPVIKADTSAIKVTPDEPGGMAIPNRDSTVFEHVTGEGEDTAKPVVENLLADAPDDVMTKDAAESEKPAPAVEKAESAAQPSSADLAAVPAKKADAPAQYTKPEKLHPAGSSPETLAFVKSVLEEQSEGEGEGAATTDVPPPPKTAIVPEAPAAPKAAPAETSAHLTHYVQLSSIREAERAEKEWAALQSKYGAQLSGAGHRVERKDLGDKGIYYRIQAGPFTKADATAKCDAIKAVTPSGCYLVAK